MIGSGPRFISLVKRHKIDLCMMHFFGASDAEEVIHHARSYNIPIALENHFSNDRFLHLSIRKHVMMANGVAGMNQLDVPNYLAKRFCNLSDGIDVDFFDLQHAQQSRQRIPKTILFLPSRIVRPKDN